MSVRQVFSVTSGKWTGIVNRVKKGQLAARRAAARAKRAKRTIKSQKKRNHLSAA